MDDGTPATFVSASDRRERFDKMTVALLIPVLNEAAALPHILPEIDPGWVNEIVVVDGGSTDGSRELLRTWGRGIVIQQQVPGISNAYWEAFPYISSDVIITFSPDGNSLPGAIPLLIQKMREGYDMVVASRYLPGAGSEDDSAVTRFGNWMFTRLINWLFLSVYSDVLVMLRAYRKALIKELDMDTHAPAFEPQLGIRCAVAHRRVAEIPIREPKRIGGERKMKLFINGWAIVILIAKEWIRQWRLRSSGAMSPGKGAK